MPRRVGTWSRWVGVAALAAVGYAAQADEPKRTSGDESTLRLFHVDALVAGQQDFISERSGFVGPQEVNNEEHPLFGMESEEPTRPVGGIDELIELLKSEVEGDSWGNTSGVDIRAMGSNVIVAQHRPEALAALGAAIKRWEDRWLRTVTVDVQAVRLPADAGTASPADLAALADGAAAGPGVSITAFPGQRASAFAGRQRASVCDYDVEVAQKAKTGDPFVGVTNLGLAVDVRATPFQGEGRVLLWVRGALTELVGTSSVKGVADGNVETLVLGTTSIECEVDVAAGTWTLADGAGLEGGKPGWSFLVRARVNARGPREPRRGDSLPVLASAGIGRLVRRTYDIDALRARIPSRQAPVSSLYTSSYTPPEPPELPEPRCAIEPDNIPDLMRTAIAPEVWEQGSLEVKGGTLIVRAPETAHAAVGRMLASLHHHLLWTVEVAAEVVEVPAALAALQDPLLTDEGAKALATALKDGSAARLDHLRVATGQSSRNFTSAGRQRTYIRDFDVEIAEDAVIGNPIIGTIFAGAIVDVQPSVNSTWDGAAITVRFQRTWLPDDLPTFVTSWGQVTVPDMRVLRLRTGLEVPFGRTAVVGSLVENGRRTLLLLTPTLRRAGD